MRLAERRLRVARRRRPFGEDAGVFRSERRAHGPGVGTFAPQWFKSVGSLQLSGGWSRNRAADPPIPAPFVRRYAAFAQGALMMPVAQPLAGTNPAMAAPDTPK